MTGTMTLTMVHKMRAVVLMLQLYVNSVSDEVLECGDLVATVETARLCE